jgi:hypothetical protein
MDRIILYSVFCVLGAGRAAAQTATVIPEYKQLREAQLTESFIVENVELNRDVATITLRSGSVSFAPPVSGRVTLGVFTGQGTIRLNPVEPNEQRHMRNLIEARELVEQFDRAVFVFTDATYKEIAGAGKARPAESAAAEALRDFRGRIRHSTESPRSFLEALLATDSVENADALVLADLLGPARPGFFSAWLHGKKYGDLRFHLRPRGALPELPSPEEVALVNFDPGGEKEGIWYLSHLKSELTAGAAPPREDKRVVEARHFKIDTTIGGNKHLKAMAEVRFRAVTSGERVLGFGLLPTLRVSRVRSQERDIPFIQEAARADGSLYLVWPEPLEKGKEYTAAIEYAGDKVIRDAGGGNYAVGARENWYPSINSFQDRATYDLTFRIQKGFKLTSVGKPARESTEGGLLVSRWVSEVPLAVAGFNYGRFDRKDSTVPELNYKIEGFATGEVPGYLRDTETDLPGAPTQGRLTGKMTPSTLLDSAMAQTRGALLIFERYFGRPPYDRIAVTQQPQFSFGQSWPGLLYLPLSAFLDSTQRWQLMDSIDTSLTDFVEEVTPHEVSHQWWGHMVGWDTYRDQWLSEGFADFSAGLYLQAVEKKRDKYLRYLERSRDVLLEKNKFGLAPADAGPLSMGLRLISLRNPRAYNGVVYSKGGMVVHMLRMMMWDQTTHDSAFIAMMREFTSRYLHQNPSTADFQAVAEKHMTPAMDVERNQKLDWFFRQWVYGTEIPKYELTYDVSPQPDGKYLLKGRLTQSGVGERFAMVVPLYIDMDGTPVRAARLRLHGNSSFDGIQMTLPGKPRRVLVNAYHDVLSRK